MQDNTFSIICDIEYKMSSFLENEMKHTELAGFSHSYGKIMLQLNKFESLSMKKIATLINKTPQTVTTLIVKLVKMGFIKLEMRENDNRTKYVCITEKGKAVIPKIIQISEALYDKQFTNFSEEEQKQLRTLLIKLQKNFCVKN